MIARVTLLFALAAFPASVPAQAQQTAGARPQPVLPSDAQGWRIQAASDLDAVHHTIAADHPGAYVDRDSSRFRDWIDHGYELSRSRLWQVSDAPSYYYLLQGYVGGFRDEHIQLWPVRALVVATRSWPGFSTRWVDGRYVVAGAGADPALPPNGAELVSCGGVPAKTLAGQRLDRFEGNLETDTGRFRTAPRLLWERGNPFVPPVPTSCAFRIGGKLQTMALHYRPGEQEELIAASKAASATVAAAPGVRQWNGNWWIGLPAAFSSEKDWQQIYDGLEANLAAVREAPLVLIDARGTTGGSSGYGRAFVRRLFGEAMFRAYEPKLGDVVWRVSPDNRAFLEDVVKQIRAEPTLAPDLPNYEARIARFDEAVKAGKPTIYEDNDSAPRPTPPAENPVKGRVVVLTDYSCVSACLDFMDLVMAMPNVVQAGVSTDADTIFMEANRAPVPSGLFLLDVPHKAWIERPRGSNQPYVPKPALLYHGDLNDGAAFEQWLRRIVA